MANKPIIRLERADDRAAVRRVNERAFEQPGEADLVEALHRANAVILSLVAEIEGVVVGHIMFSPMTIPGKSSVRIAGLGPMAVIPEFQSRGVGSALVSAGLERCKEREVDAVVLVGHPNYYPRFGFHPASHHNLSCEWDVPDDVFLALELSTGSLKDVNGIIKYRREFQMV